MVVESPAPCGSIGWCFRHDCLGIPSQHPHHFVWEYKAFMDKALCQEPCGIVIPGNFESASYRPVVFTHVDSPADLGFPVIRGLWYCWFDGFVHQRRHEWLEWAEWAIQPKTKDAFDCWCLFEGMLCTWFQRRGDCNIRIYIHMQMYRSDVWTLDILQYGIDNPRIGDSY